MLHPSGCIPAPGAIDHLAPALANCAKIFSWQALAGGTQMAYDLDQFIADCRDHAEARSRPRRPRAGPRQSRAAAAQPGLRREVLRRRTSPRGLKVLYEDPELKFQVLAHINDKARVSPPHDHGASWAIYGQATQVDRHDRVGARGRRHRSQARQAQAGEEVPARTRATPASTRTARSTRSTIRTTSRFVRVTGTNLDNINRIRIDLKTGEVHQMTPQQAT